MSPKKIKKECPICSIEFISYRCENKKICSRKCFSSYMKQHPNKGQFTSERKAFKGRKHSEKSRKKMRDITLQRIASGDIDVNALAQKSRAYTTGEKNVNWKGGITSASRRERLRFRRVMQKKIFARDNYTCVKCDKADGGLSVDHIKSWADHPQLRFEEDNCQTLCMGCHYEKTFGRPKPDGLVWGHNLKKAESRIKS